jgi:uridine kinase
MALSSGYLSCLQAIAQGLLLQHSTGPALRVAVDGRSGVGKSTFSAALVQTLIDQGRPACCVQLDDFHHPRAKRYARGRYSAEGYYRDARDLEALVTMCLAPLGPNGSGRYAAASFDLEKNEPIEPDWRSATPGEIVVVEGTFLLRPELNPHWDVRICLHAPQEVARQRGIGRDRALLGDESEALYRQRYDGAYTLYESECAPTQSADWQVDMTDFDAPALMKT